MVVYYGMSHRVTLTLDDEAYAIYKAQPHHQRGAWGSAAFKAAVGQGDPPPLRNKVMAFTYTEQIHHLCTRIMLLFDQDI
jgi:hypothetical protein